MYVVHNYTCQESSHIEKKKSKESQCKYTLNLYIRHFYNDFLKDGRLLWNVDSTVVQSEISPQQKKNKKMSLNHHKCLCIWTVEPMRTAASPSSYCDLPLCSKTVCQTKPIFLKLLLSRISSQQQQQKAMNSSLIVVPTFGELKFINFKGSFFTFV